jgi:D-alanyl-D-alanine carboxypeptidase (penicillin-binding protein 5/6)
MTIHKPEDEELDARVPKGRDAAVGLARLGNNHAGPRRAMSPRRVRRLIRTGAVLAVVGLLSVVAAARVDAAAPKPVQVLATGSSLVVPGTAIALPWPRQGESAIAVPRLDLVVSSGREQSVPVASLTKIMTAFVVLRDHPLTSGASGPVVTMSALDVANTGTDERENETSVPVYMGEKLTERQLLQGLLVHSANNFAHTLARFDAGSTASFVAKMNQTAAALGLRSTHFVGPSGFNPGSVSTASDLLRLASAAMAVPAFAQIVDEREVMLPDGGLLQNYVSLVGTDGVIGVKSGFTAQAEGCVVLAAKRYVSGTPVTILAAVTGQAGYDALGKAEREALVLIDTAARSIENIAVLARGEVVGRVKVPWSDVSPRVDAASGASLLAWPGQVVRLQVFWSRFRRVEAGERVGTIRARLGTESAAVPLTVDGSVGGPSTLWRIVHG